MAGSWAEVNWNDMVLAFSLIHSSANIVRKWDAFGQCSKPLHVWLLVSYLAMLVFRAAHYIGQCSSEDSAESALKYLKQCRASFLIIKATWFVVLPCFAAWTVLGTSWSLSILNATPTCLPVGTHPWFICFWQILCYAWIAIYSVFVGVSFRYERWLKKMEREHHCLVASEDALQRWGELPFLPDSVSLHSQGLCQGDIQTLPKLHFGDIGIKRKHRPECAICLGEFKSQEVCRKLPGCGHVFHESCIDLWLLRRGECPLCKQRIQACTALL
jgi:hypothetical protein